MVSYTIGLPFLETISKSKPSQTANLVGVAFHKQWPTNLTPERRNMSLKMNELFAYEPIGIARYPYCWVNVNLQIVCFCSLTQHRLVSYSKMLYKIIKIYLKLMHITNYLNLSWPHTRTCPESQLLVKYLFVTSAASSFQATLPALVLNNKVFYLNSGKISTIQS